MATSTNRNNVKPMFTGIAFMMMVFYRLLTTKTLKDVRWRKSPRYHSVTNSCSGFTIFWILFMAVFLGSSAFTALSIMFPCSFAFIAFFILFSSNLPFFALVISFVVSFHIYTCAFLALCLKSIRTAPVFTKFRNRFNFLASATSFCYSCLRHGFFSVKKLCLEPVVGYTPIVGSFHSIGLPSLCKAFFLILIIFPVVSLGAPGQILDANSDPYEISTVYGPNDLSDIHYVQSNDVMYLVHPDHPPQKLSRFDHASWTIADVDWEWGPFLDDNTETTTITPSDVNGTITLTASANIFDANHVGSIWKIVEKSDNSYVTGTLDANESSTTVAIEGEGLLTLEGTWNGLVSLEKSIVDANSWEPVYPKLGGDAANIEYSFDEDNAGYEYRVTMTDYLSGSCKYTLTAYNSNVAGYVEITVYDGTLTGSWQGTFDVLPVIPPKDLLVDSEGNEIARGLTNYSSAQIEKIKGLKTAQIADALGDNPYDVVVHRDNMTVV